MRVIGRVLLGTLAIVFAVVFVARLVRRRRSHRGARGRLVRSLDAASVAARPAHARTYLAAQPGGSGWGRLVVPPSSPSRALRRRGRRGGRRLTGYPGRRRAALQKSVRVMTYAVWQSRRRRQHGARESIATPGVVLRLRPRAGAGARGKSRRRGKS